MDQGQPGFVLGLNRIRAPTFQKERSETLVAATRKLKLPFVWAVLFLLIGCSFWKVGMDPRGQSLKLTGNIVATGTVKYIAEMGKVPTKVADLCPKFIDFIPGEEFSIEGHGNDVSIVIRYKPTWPQSGQIICSRRIATPDWSCVGHY